VTTSNYFVFSFVLALAACRQDAASAQADKPQVPSKKLPNEAQPSPSKPPTSSAASSGKALRLEKFGLDVDAPPDAKVVAADPMVKVIGATVSASIWKTSKKGDAWSIEEERRKTPDFYPGADKFQEERLADGWLLAFEYPRMDTRAFAVTSRRDIGGASYTCSVDTAAHPEEAAALCRSLRK
jgi:hypothetical protein